MKQTFIRWMHSRGFWIVPLAAVFLLIFSAYAISGSALGETASGVFEFILVILGIFMMVAAIGSGV